jgi:hypothetical protein
MHRCCMQLFKQLVLRFGAQPSHGGYIDTYYDIIGLLCTY